MRPRSGTATRLAGRRGKAGRPLLDDGRVRLAIWAGPAASRQSCPVPLASPRSLSGLSRSCFDVDRDNCDTTGGRHVDAVAGRPRGAEISSHRRCRRRGRLCRPAQGRRAAADPSRPGLAARRHRRHRQPRLCRGRAPRAGGRRGRARQLRQGRRPVAGHARHAGRRRAADHRARRQPAADPCHRPGIRRGHAPHRRLEHAGRTDQLPGPYRAVGASRRRGPVDPPPRHRGRAGAGAGHQRRRARHHRGADGVLRPRRPDPGGGADLVRRPCPVQPAAPVAAGRWRWTRRG